MSSTEIRGRFVWHELITTDSAGAGAFYPRVAGWKSQPWEQDSNYTLWVGHSGPMGGLISQPKGTESSPSQWMPYIGTPDLEGTISTAQDLGARLCREITQIPGAGRFAILADPQGASFAVYAAGEAQEGNAATPPQVGDFSWHELATTDLDAAFQFYSRLFGWGKGPGHDMGEMGMYQLFTQGGKQVGGIYRLNPQITDLPHWLCYVRVSDVGEATNAAKAAGGRVVQGPMEVPGGDWIAHVIDPQGAAFAVHEIKPLASLAPVKKAPKAAAAKPAASTRNAAASGTAAQSTASRSASRVKRSASVKRAKPKSSAAKRSAAGARTRAAKRVAAKRTTAKRGPAKKAHAATRVRSRVRKRVAKKRVSRRLRARKRR